MAAELLWMRHSTRPHQRRPGIRAAHPTTGQVGIFPLHRPALGQLWLTEEETSGWTFESAGADVPQATMEFAAEVDYPAPFLAEALQAVIRGRDSLGGRVSWSRWRQLVQEDRDRLFITVSCARCCRQRRLAFFTFAHAPRELPSLACLDLHALCWRDQSRPAALVEWEEAAPSPVPLPLPRGRTSDHASGVRGVIRGGVGL